MENGVILKRTHIVSVVGLWVRFSSGAGAAVLLSLRRRFRAQLLPTALTLPLPLNSTPPPASIHGDGARGFPEHLTRGFWRQKKILATATAWRAPVAMVTVSTKPVPAYQSSASCQLTALCRFHATTYSTAQISIVILAVISVFRRLFGWKYEFCHKIFISLVFILKAVCRKE